MAAKTVKNFNATPRELTAYVPLTAPVTPYNLANATAAAQAKLGGADLLEANPGDEVTVLDQNSPPAAGAAYMFRVVRLANGQLSLQQFDFGLGVAAGQNRA